MDLRESKRACILQKHIFSTFSPKIIEFVPFILIKIAKKISWVIRQNYYNFDKMSRGAVVIWATHLYIPLTVTSKTQ